MTDPSPLSQGLGLLAAACLVLLIAAVIANIRWPKTHPSAAAAPSAAGGCTTTGCKQPPVEKYHGRNLCRDCADELAALDQMILQQQEFDDFRAWERESGGAS